MTIRLLITDDHNLVRESLVQYLDMQPDIEVVGQAANGEELLKLLPTTFANLLLLDQIMPGLCGTELIAKVKQRYFGLPILVLSMHNEPQIVLRALRAGASGYICKDCTPEALLEAIRKVGTTGKYLSPEMAEQIAFLRDSSEQNPFEDLLSDRERQIFLLLVNGKNIHEIAAYLGISEKTVSTHKLNLLNKLGLKNTVDMVRYAIQVELI